VGEWKQQVPVKLDVATVARIDELVEQFSPFCEGRSALVRILVEFSLAAIDQGILTFDLNEIQQVLSKPRTPKLLKRGA
jgi:hypothetical protein